MVGPLFAIDLIEAGWAHHTDLRALAQRLLGPLVAGAALLAYVVAFVLPQSFASSYNTWQAFYAPHGAAALWHFLVAKEQTYLVGAVTGIPLYDTRAITLILPTNQALADAMKLTVLVLVLAGIWELARYVLGRGVIVAALGGLVLQLIASLDRQWPFGLALAPTCSSCLSSTCSSAQESRACGGGSAGAGDPVGPPRSRCSPAPLWGSSLRCRTSEPHMTCSTGRRSSG